MRLRPSPGVKRIFGELITHGTCLSGKLQISYFRLLGNNNAHLNPLAGFEGHFETGKKRGKQEGGDERTRETPRNKFLVIA